MSTVKKNIVANFMGNTWNALMSLAFIPLYIKFMGVEAYGVVGVYVALQAIFSLLDMGLSTTLSREMARLSALQDKAQEMRTLLRTLEVVYWGVSLAIGIIIVVFAPLIAHHWVQPGHLTPDTIQQAIMIMGLVMVLQFPFTLYSGGLIGLQHQVLLNGITATMTTLRGAGVVIVLWLISPTVQAFFGWQVFISAMQTFLVTMFLWRRLPHRNERARFDKGLFRGIWRFAAGVSGITLTSVVLTNMDKIVLSKFLSLETFGYYTLASAVAINLLRVVAPFNMAVSPRFVQFLTQDNQEQLKLLYHRSCQFVSVLVLPAAIVVAFFSKEILLLWTQNPTIAEHTHLVLSILIVGTALNGLMNMPYSLQIASGWTSLAFYINLGFLIILIPTLIVMVSNFGAVGAATLWAVLNAGYVLIGIQLMHRRLIPSEKWRWYLEDVSIPFLGALATAGLVRWFVDGPLSQGAMLVTVIALSILTLLVSAIMTPQTRLWLFSKITAKSSYEFRKI